jgi:hypothetical protein
MCAGQAFLSTVAQQHNVSLFHYRNTGERQGKVLVGLQVSSAWNQETEDGPSKPFASPSGERM